MAIIGMYVSGDGIARKVKKQHVGVGSVARMLKKAFIGVNGVARECYAGLHYITECIDPYPENGNTQSIDLGEGTVTLYQRSSTPSEIGENRTVVRAKLYGLSVGDIVTFDWSYDGPGTSSSTIYYIDAIVAFGTTGDRIFLVHRDGSGSIEHTVTEEDVSRVFLRFEVNNGRGANQTQTFTITNLKVNGSLVSA